jgi:hypothetical protein
VATDQREAGHAVLARLKRWTPELEEFTAAANRRYARFPLDYSKGFAMPLPHLTYLLNFPPVYRLRCIAALETGDTRSALQDVKTLDRTQNAIRSEPLLISFLVRLTMIKFLMQPIWQGLAEHLWPETELREIEAVLARTDLITDYAWVLRGERAAANLSYSKFRASRRPTNSILAECLSWLEPPRRFWIYALLPNEAVMCHNQEANERWVQDHVLPVADGARHRVFPAEEAEAVRVNENTKSTPYNMLAKMAADTMSAFSIRAAATQTDIDEALVACALERFRLRNGQFPNDLDALIPDYLKALPHDVIDGAPLRYRRESSDTYLLYSVGWNQIDEEGLIVPDRSRRDNKKGDWVWLSTPAK